MNLTRLESKVFSQEKLFPLSLVEVSKTPKNGSRKKICHKILDQKTNLRSGFFLNKFGLKKLLGQKKMGLNKFKLKKNFGPKIVRPQTNFESKKFKSAKNCGSNLIVFYGL